MKADTKYVYFFGAGQTEGNTNMRELLGGKGANLAEMAGLGLPVPQGFTITTEACTRYYDDGKKVGDDIVAQVMEYIDKLEKSAGKKFGDTKNPLLVSVRSGARASMPGMMDTILNLGLNEEVVESLAEQTKNPRWAWDCYRRFIQMFSDVVMEVGKKYFEKLIDEMKEKKGVKLDVELTAEDLKELATQFKAEYKSKIGKDFPSDAKEQLFEAIKAVFRSWDNPRANVYRRDNDIPYSWGTAVNVQMMAFGNLNDESGTGVAFTRDPATGEKKLMGEFLMNAQGEDVVAGVRTPMPIAKMAEVMPDVFKQFQDICKKLEAHYRDMQDMEFTIENKKLFMLQTRNGKRTAKAALKIACDLVDEGMRTEEEAVLMIDPRNLDTLLHPQFDIVALKKAQPIGRGLAASPGAACGKIVFTAADAKAWKSRGEKVVLVRLETSPEDIEGMKAAEGILTVRGGMTSHAAVVARGMGECCVSGCQEIIMDEENKKFVLSGKTFKEGDWLSIDGSTGNIYDGVIPTVDASIVGEFGRIMMWADKFRKLKVRTNADTPRDAKKARELGAEGIGLCRTEHMFFSQSRITPFREMICSDTVEERRLALAKILPYQQDDFEQLFEALDGQPVTIRFLDPPLHEFVPHTEDEIALLAKTMHKPISRIKDIIDSLHEFNPMMGHRGCRLCVTYPEIAVMQTKAVIRAAIAVQRRHKGWNVKPEIMIPLTGDLKEFKFVKDIVVHVANDEIQAAEIKLNYEVGTMIEVPRAALCAGEIAEEAEFFCFGTNDLTQMTFGFSRDDAGKFLNSYYDHKIYENDPFAKLDQEGVGKLMEMAVVNGKATRPKIHCGICGEHGGDPTSVEFCHNLGLDYVSCSPYRVPIARLAAAQAALRKQS
ncbi:MAG: pyruvate, phosphate dikinase [Kiritimatiellae bacterium]|nr:pyruvate, phosphate dikinase [Kiritimatiellia bacterium]